MRITFFLIILILLNSPIYAAFEKTGNGAGNIGLSLSGVASKTPDFDVFTNPALIRGQNEVSLYYINYYNIKELKQMAINTEFKLFNQPFGLGIMHYGNKIYSETEIIAATSYALHKNIIAGISSNLYYLNIQNYGNAFSFSFNFSILYILNDQFRLAGIINDINEPKLGSSGEQIPLSATFGFSYSPISDIEILVDTFKEDYFDFAYRFGTRIKAISNINILAGFQNKINRFSAGVEINQDKYSIIYSIDIHPVINTSHAIGFKYAF